MVMTHRKLLHSSTATGLSRPFRKPNAAPLVRFVSRCQGCSGAAWKRLRTKRSSAWA